MVDVRRKFVCFIGQTLYKCLPLICNCKVHTCRADKNNSLDGKWYQFSINAICNSKLDWVTKHHQMWISSLKEWNLLFFFLWSERREREMSRQRTTPPVSNVYSMQAGMVGHSYFVEQVIWVDKGVMYFQ